MASEGLIIYQEQVKRSPSHMSESVTGETKKNDNDP